MQVKAAGGTGIRPSQVQKHLPQTRNLATASSLSSHQLRTPRPPHQEPPNAPSTAAPKRRYPADAPPKRPHQWPHYPPPCWTASEWPAKTRTNPRQPTWQTPARGPPGRRVCGAVPGPRNASPPRDYPQRSARDARHPGARAKQGRQVGAPRLGHLRVSHLREGHRRRRQPPEEPTPGIKPPQHSPSAAHTQAIDLADAAIECRLQPKPRATIVTRLDPSRHRDLPAVSQGRRSN